MIDASVPILTSSWSGTETVIVDVAVFRCMLT